MAWIKLPHDWLEDDAVIAAGVEGRALYIAAQMHIAKQLSDGVIKASAITLINGIRTELASLRQQLADRDAATVASARQAVLDKHLQRGALTPAMQADAAYMGDLAPLKPDALDRVLSKLPGLAAPVAPRAAGTDPTGAVDPAAVELTAEDRAMARAAGLTDEVFLATKRRDAERFAR